MAERRATALQRRVAAEVLDHLRATEWLKIDDLRALIGTSFPTVNRSLRWLRDLGAPLEGSNWGVKLTDRDWQIPENEREAIERARAAGVIIVEKPVIVERVVERVVERLVKAPDLTDWLEAATTGDLVAELERRGWTVSISKVCKPPRSDERPSLIGGREAA